MGLIKRDYTYEAVWIPCGRRVGSIFTTKLRGE